MSFTARWFSLFIDCTGARFLLDVGIGTGRIFRIFKQTHPALRPVGVEPVSSLRKLTHQHSGVADEWLEGNTCALQLLGRSFDFVSLTVVLHRTPKLERALFKMLRVGRSDTLISDRFRQRCRTLRHPKYALWKFGLWPLMNLLNAKGRGYHQ
jgi:ubiquinone/menaquinone biosynthesis C-methylase UbiE